MQLNETKAFAAWGSDAEVDRSIPSPSSKVTLPQLTVGGKKMSLEEVTRVAFFKTMVSLDPGTLQHVGEKTITSSGSKAAEVPIYNSSATGSVLPREACRAAILQLIIIWMQGRSGVRMAAIEFLADLLNSGCVPVFTSLASAPLELLLTCNGQYAKCLSSSDNSVKAASVALRECSLTPFSLNNTEMCAILQGEFAFTGMAGFVCGYAQKSFQILDVVAAMSCEAAGVTLGDSIDPAVFELLRPQRGQMSSASNLKLLLDGSRNCNGAAGDNDAVFKATPQIHGPAFETSLSSCRCVICMNVVSVM